MNAESESTSACVPGHDRDLHPRAPVPVQPDDRTAGNQPARPGAARDHRHAGPGRLEDYAWIADGMAIGASSALGARRVKMTAMPQMVALFNGVGGGAAP